MSICSPLTMRCPRSTSNKGALPTIHCNLSLPTPQRSPIIATQPSCSATIPSSSALISTSQAPSNSSHPSCPRRLLIHTLIKSYLSDLLPPSFTSLTGNPQLIRPTSKPMSGPMARAVYLVVPHLRFDYLIHRPPAMQSRSRHSSLEKPTSARGAGMVGLSKESVVGLEDSFNRDISRVYIFLPFCYFVFFSHRLAFRDKFYSTAGDSVGAHGVSMYC